MGDEPSNIVVEAISNPTRHGDSLFYAKHSDMGKFGNPVNSHGVSGRQVNGVQQSVLVNSTAT